jgi:tRNA (guanine-N7-)-methyltransferase
MSVLADRAMDVQRRPIRSFVLRQGRFTPAQQRAFDLYWPRYGLDYTGALRDLDAAFGRAAPRVLELGFGNGEPLLHSACAEPARDFIGIEVHRPGVGRLMNGLATAGVANVRLYDHDAVDVLRDEIPPDSLAEVRIYFPDPWPKKRHQKRRLIQPEFLVLLASRVVRAGRLHLATDWADYAQHIAEALAQAPLWKPDPYHPIFLPSSMTVKNRPASMPDFSKEHSFPLPSTARPPWRIETHFERRGLRLGHGVWDFVYERI